MSRGRNSSDCRSARSARTTDVKPGCEVPWGVRPWQNGKPLGKLPNQLFLAGINGSALYKRFSYLFLQIIRFFRGTIIEFRHNISQTSNNASVLTYLSSLWDQFASGSLAKELRIYVQCCMLQSTLLTKPQFALFSGKAGHCQIGLSRTSQKTSRSAFCERLLNKLSKKDVVHRGTWRIHVFEVI